MKRRGFKRNSSMVVAIASAAVIFALCILLSPPTPAYANSALKYLDGVDATGAIMRGENDISVEKEKLTFDLSEFPQYYYDSDEEFLKYSGKVTAEYTFVNSSADPVTATLCFPFGSSPSYAPGYPYLGEYFDGSDGEYNSDHLVTVRGERVDAKLRHTYCEPYLPFEVERDLGRICDSYRDDVFYTPDLPVVKYSYTVEYIQNAASDNYVYAAFEVTNIDDNARVFFPEMTDIFPVGERYRVGTWVEEGCALSVYVFGEDASSNSLPQWKFYANGGLGDDEAIRGRMSAPVVETMTFEEFALFGRDEDSDVSKVDWYNAILDQLVEKRVTHACPAVTLEGYAATLKKNLMRWYEYDIAFAPGERVVNSVSAPIYPTIFDNFDPPKYFYTYLLSPAKTWSDFGELTIEINTPYFMLDHDDFEKTEDGYALTVDGLPNGELTFTLCASERPEEEMASIWWIFIAIILAFISIFDAFIPITGIAGSVAMLLTLLRPALDIIGAIVTLIIIGVRSAVKKKRKRDRVLPPAPREDGKQTRVGDDQPRAIEADAPPSSGDATSPPRLIEVDDDPSSTGNNATPRLIEIDDDPSSIDDVPRE